MLLIVVLECLLMMMLRAGERAPFIGKIREALGALDGYHLIIPLQTFLQFGIN